jgi:signal transduction histidine kinase
MRAILSRWISDIRRLAILFFVSLSASVACVGIFLYAAYRTNLYAESKAAIDADLQGLIDLHRIAGDSLALKEAVNSRINQREVSSFYLLSELNGPRLAGNIDMLPPIDEALEDGFELFGIPYSEITENAPPFRDYFYPHYDVLAKSTTLTDPQTGGSLRLLVGRDVDAFQTNRLIFVSLSWLMIAVLTLVALLGFLMAAAILRRIRTIQQTAMRVIETGDLSSRIPTADATGDFRPFAETLNGMLARIQELVDGIRQVGDSIAHDLRTPLTRLRQLIEMMRKGDRSVSIVEVEQEVEHIIATFNALLRISNIEFGKRSIGFAELDACILLRDLHEYYSLLTQGNNQQFELILKDNLPGLRGDKDLLFQAFSNILENAIKFTQSGGLITLSAEPLPHGVCVCIRDTGPGIADVDKSKVFQRFYRSDTSCQSPGNGLGLTLVKAVMDLHKARIELRDHHPTGLEVRITFTNITKC